MEFSKENGCFGHLLKFYHIMRMEGGASRSWLFRSFSIWMSVAGIASGGGSVTGLSQLWTEKQFLFVGNGEAREFAVIENRSNTVKSHANWSPSRSRTRTLRPILGN